MYGVNRRVLPGFSLSLGYTVFYLSVLVLIPLAACFLKAATLSPAAFWAAVWTERARAAYTLTFGASLAAAALNAALGLLKHPLFLAIPRKVLVPDSRGDAWRGRADPKKKRLPNVAVGYPASRFERS